MKKGMLVNFEGLDFSGKSTAMEEVVRRIKERVKGSELKIVKLLEPGTTEIGSQIRGVLHDMKNHQMSPRTEVLLYEASRAELVDKMIKPELVAGTLIFADRFDDSTTAYQGYGRRLGSEEIKKLNLFATGGIKPDLTFLFDIPVDEMVRRKERDSSREYNRMDAQEIDFYERVRYGYIILASGDPRWVTIDATKSREVIADEVERKVMERLILKGLIEGQKIRRER